MGDQRQARKRPAAPRELTATEQALPTLKVTVAIPGNIADIAADAAARELRAAQGPARAEAAAHDAVRAALRFSYESKAQS